MDRLAAFFVRRLRHMARREVRRRTLRNGLLTASIVLIDGRAVCRYMPAFDAARLSGDAEQDRHWIRVNLAAFLAEPAKDGLGNPDPLAPALVLAPHLLRGSKKTEDRPGMEERRRDDYAVRLIGEAGEAVGIMSIATALMLARAVQDAGLSLREVADLLRQPAPIVSVDVPAEGFERALLRLIEETGLVPFGPYVAMAVEFMHGEEMWAWKASEVKRVFLYSQGTDTSRPGRQFLRRHIAAAAAHGCPMLGVTEKAGAMPDQIEIASDIRLSGRGIDAWLVADLLEAIHGEKALGRPDAIDLIDAGALTLEDLGLAVRPGRPLETSLEALARLAARNRNERDDGGDDSGNDNHGPARRLISQSPTEKARNTPNDSNSADSSSAGSGSSSKGRSKRKPTGAEVVQPQPLAPKNGGDGKPPLIIETLSGYGAARDWALGLKADLADYRNGDLDWSGMSTKLLLSGPPGTGKTTFAKALCNSLQIPLVVTSVSTWLQGDYLHSVLDRMADTFGEARAQAPCILFVDEIDGIGMRVNASRDHADYWNTCVNKLLELLDGAVKSEGVIVVGATNRPNEIDEAIRRSGRLETHIEIPRPDIPALAGILAHHLGADLDVIAANLTREGAAS